MQGTTGTLMLVPVKELHIASFSTSEPFAGVGTYEAQVPLGTQALPIHLQPFK